MPHLRASRALLEGAVSAPAQTFETKIANLIRMLGTDHEGEAVATWHALKRLLATRDVTFTDLGNGIESLATGDLKKAEMERLFKAGYAKGVEDEARKRIAQGAVHGQRADGSTDWEAIALYCQREKARLEAKHHQFVDDMASRMAWGREPTERQGIYLVSLFRKLGGRMNS
jgi:hypothetical protein